jgi:hypothetical protein
MADKETAARSIALSISAAPPEAALYLVATPIGSARDITLRALDVLNTADVLAAEDTRTLRHLMDIHGIPLRGRRMIAYHDHNADRARPGIIEALRAGLGALVGLGVAGLFLLSPQADQTLGLYLIAPFGATSVLVFAVPNSPLAQPWSAVVGNAAAALVGVLACIRQPARWP